MRLLFIFIFFGFYSLAQTKEVDTLYLVLPGDSIAKTHIDLSEVIIFPPLSFTDAKAQTRYFILRKKVLKTYPYAKMAATRLTSLRAELQNFKKKRHKKRHAKKAQQYIEKKFSKKLKKLTKTEGQILVKLIYRQTGETAFNLVKELRSGWRAFWYQATAKLFTISLKQGYYPKNSPQDAQIEDILQRAFADKILEP